MKRFAGYLAAFVGAALMFAFVATADAGKLTGSGSSFSLSSLLTQDGAGSGVDADLLDGISSAGFLQDGVCSSQAVCANVTSTGVDYTCSSGTECRIASSGAANLNLQSGNSTIGIFNSAGAGDPEFTIYVTDGNTTALRTENSVANMSFSTSGVTAGALLDTVATTTQFRAGDGVQTDGTITRSSFEVYGENTGRWVPQDALSLTVTTDTASTPLGSSNTGAGTACRMSSAGGVTNWTPSETGAVDGMFWCCTNTGTNAITMLDSDGVYEGPGSVVGQYDQVCFEYVGTRFVERSFSNNEP